MSENIIEINGLTKSFGEVQAVSNIDLSVKKGEMFGIVGPDGAGKTTTIRMLCGIIESDDGRGNILGYDFIKEKEKIKDHIGYLSQKFSLYQDLTIDENIEFFAEIHGVVKYKEKRDELLEFTRLTSFRKRLAGKLSGGMKQKLALACTLIHKPDIIFLDEPTTGVDPVSRRDFWRILFNLLKENISIVVTTPYLDEAERCGRIGMMRNGKFLIADTFVNIKKNMQGLIFEIITPDIKAAYRNLVKESFIKEVQTFGDRLNVVVDGIDKLEDIKKILLESGNRAIEYREIAPSLENVFISLIKDAEKKETL
jgi:ABC-2 type transport system ATP-binding protein